ncbi:type IV pilus biogenesis/stability protein PilW [Ramlibacter rhizophilus]|uniref:Type IV pilus biogenesis/stability protein PilW n=1 Tax=Ramlibacter rhizophilus TaxID=1781167 RepID=A0A4Z0BWY8_9BURK|nr:type IV pilus biogenesis/stability protein PilW [Ramlibacter rhizophilus]TFZ03222.1 type IV pilus biogenesis/stability protein PilW [Ramlibacter rhizophilus]
MSTRENAQAVSARLAGWPAGGLLVALLLLSGCASPPGSPAAGASGAREVMTESDETPERKRARIRLELAIGYFEQGRTEIALDEIKQALASDPAFGPAYNLRGLIYMRLNDSRQAEESLRRALAINPRDADALHNLGWLACTQDRHEEAINAFRQALANPTYGGRAKTTMTLGLCQARAGRFEDAEQSLARSYELDAGNPVTGYNLASLLMRRGELARAQFYIRRLNNSELANAESLWLGIRVEQRLGDKLAMTQLAEQLKKRYPQSRELAAYERGAFHE